MKNGHKNLLALGVTVLIVLVLLAGCAGKAPQQPQAGPAEGGKPVLVMGTNAEFPPFEFINEANEIDGFDVELAKAIADKLGYELKIEDMAFDGLIPALQAERIDVIVAAMTIREDRQEKVNFSDPYYNAGQVIVVKEDNEEIKGVDDLREGKTIAVQLGTTGDFEAQEITAEENIVRFQQISLAFMELELGRADAVIVDIPVAQRYMKVKPGLKIVGEPLTNEYFGIAVNKNNEELLQKINQALAEIIAEGKYDELISKWFD